MSSCDGKLNFASDANAENEGFPKMNRGVLHAADGAKTAARAAPEWCGAALRNH